MTSYNLTIFILVIIYYFHRAEWPLTRALSNKGASSFSTKMLAGILHGKMVAAVVVEENTFRHRDGVLVGKLGKMAVASMVHSEAWEKAYMVPEAQRTLVGTFLISAKMFLIPCVLWAISGTISNMFLIPNNIRNNLCVPDIMWNHFTMFLIWRCLLSFFYVSMLAKYSLRCINNHCI